jgi:hypothetical protein
MAITASIARVVARRRPSAREQQVDRVLGQSVLAHGNEALLMGDQVNDMEHGVLAATKHCANRYADGAWGMPYSVSG